MHVSKLTISQDDAAKLMQRYHTHRNYQQPNAIDMEVERIATMIAKGKMIVMGRGSVVTAGLNEARLPKLAIARADAPWCRLMPRSDGSATMTSGVNWVNGNTAQSRVFEFDAGSFPNIACGRYDLKAVMPHIPPDIRPKRGIQNYHVLWEAIWEKVPPVDPILMRQIGKSDFYLVVGQWDLTDVEREVMRSRIRLQ